MKKNSSGNAGYNLSRSAVIGLKNFIQYNHCQAVQLFRLTPFLIEAFTTSHRNISFALALGFQTKEHASISSKWEQHLLQAFLVEMAFSMTANVTITVEERIFLRNPHCLSAGSDSLYLQFKPTIWTLSYLRKHTNCTISLQERHFPTPLRHIEHQQFYWNWPTLPLQSSSHQSPKFNVDKPTQWLGQSGPTTFDLWAILRKRGYFRTTSNKMMYAMKQQIHKF